METQPNTTNTEKKKRVRKLKENPKIPRDREERLKYFREHYREQRYLAVKRKQDGERHDRIVKLYEKIKNSQNLEEVEHLFLTSKVTKKL
jgi:hypothetical protein